MNEEIEKLKRENKKLKRRNLFLIIYVIVSIGIMAYNYFTI